MTNPHSTAKTNKTQTTQLSLRDASQRHYTVGYISVRHEPNAARDCTHYSKHLALHLKGKWLELLGFTAGQPVTITAKKGKLIVELAK